MTIMILNVFLFLEIGLILRSVIYALKLIVIDIHLILQRRLLMLLILVVERFYIL